MQCSELLSPAVKGVWGIGIVFWAMSLQFPQQLLKCPSVLQGSLMCRLHPDLGITLYVGEK